MGRYSDRYEEFDLVKLVGTTAQGVTIDGKKREFKLAVTRDKATNKLTLHPYRHFIDPDSTPQFEDSEPWTEDERRGDTE